MDDNICNLLGLDINKLALELVKTDLEKRQKVKSFSGIQNKESPILVKRKEQPVPAAPSTA